MNYESWKSELKKLLRSFTYAEAQEIIDYYDEIYWDKKDAGVADEEILVEFGSPDECLKKIRESEMLASPEPIKKEESAKKEDNEPENLQPSVDVNQSTEQSQQKQADEPAWEFGKGTQTGQDGKKESASNALVAVLMIVATVFVSVWVFIGLYAATLTCAVVSVGGIVGAIYSVISGLFGGFMQWMATAGACLVASGVCTILALYLFRACKFLTKWYIGLMKKTLGVKGGKADEIKKTDNI